MGHRGDRPVGAVDGQPAPVPAAGHRLPAPVHVGRLGGTPPVDAQLPVAERVPEHRGQPVQPRELPFRQQPVGQPGALPQHGRRADREAARDQQQHELVPEQDLGGVEGAGSQMGGPPDPGQDRCDGGRGGSRVPGGSRVGAPPGQRRRGDADEQRSDTDLRQQLQRDQPGEAHEQPGGDPADPSGREGDQRHRQDGLVQRPDANQEGARQPRRPDRGDQDTFGDRPAGGQTGGDERQPDRNVHGGQPGARRRCLAVGAHGERDQHPHGDDTARGNGHGARRPAQTCCMHTGIVTPAMCIDQRSPSAQLLVLAHDGAPRLPVGS
jgi:hypothetical protein